MTQLPSSHSQDQKADALRYALLLDWGTRIGLISLVISFAAYLFGLLVPHVPLDQLPMVWNQPAKTFLQQTGTPTGWGWVRLAHKGDLSNLIGIALLAGCSIPPLLGLIPLYLKRRDFLYAGICGLITIVLVLAASGLLTGGH
ncbi:MAG TPA: hypothetical protein PK441_03630 [Burkholderiaceae bacterium]|jgi:hypothetical protein|nr:hypothetical protein [Burkholderiaceae bacterium]HPL77864.1 hypothetical protein [Burkholderiaceae bacterium]